ncbi:MAG: type VI secretion system accessory protein TagJ [Yersinia sp. (in: enterobacteria)]
MNPKALIDEGKLGYALSALQDRVRQDPADVKQRIFLFQLLTVLGLWNRALTQLNVIGEMDAAALPMVQTYREAIQCEALRDEIFSGARTPIIFGKPKPWLGQLLEALKSEGKGESTHADALRQQAFSEAHAFSGTINGERFDWLADADPRLGPVLEVIINGRYFWVPMEHIQRIELDTPEDLRDSVWMPATFTWINEGQIVGLIPSRYPGTVARTNNDAMLLGHLTEWEEGSGHGVGQRMLVTDGGDYPLMDVRVIEFDAHPPADGDIDTEVSHG